MLTDTKSDLATEHTVIGAFPANTRFAVHLGDTGIRLSVKPWTGDGQRSSQNLHFDYVLFADILRDLAKAAAAQPPLGVLHRDALRDSARTLYFALETNPDKALKLIKRTPHERRNPIRRVSGR
jgi:hypothetical protein